MKQKLLRRSLVVLGLSMGLLAAMPASAGWGSWWSKSIEGSGRVVTEDKQVQNFRAVLIAVPGKIQVRQGEREGVQIETDDNIQTAMETVVEGETLKIRMKQKDTYPKTRHLNVTIYVKQIDELALESSGSVQSDKIVSNDLKLRIGGSGDVIMSELKADTLKVTIGGSGSFSARGVAPQISAAIGGSGKLDMRYLSAKDVRISIGGSGKVDTWVSDNLSVSIGGSGNVNYYGDPRVSKSIGGSGSVTRQGSAP
ncbi:MAG: DUF2807 domain-containing protein [Burkholderiales bacterium]|nr:DUF2807 domain-containing protein [Burkholderiales bacterium]